MKYDMKYRKILLIILVCIMFFSVLGNASMIQAAGVSSSQEEKTGRLPLVNGETDIIGHYQFNYTGNYNYFSNFNESVRVEENVQRQNTLGGSYKNSSKGKLKRISDDTSIVKAYLIWETRKPYNKNDSVTLVASDKKTKKKFYADYAYNDNRKWDGWKDASGKVIDMRRVYSQAADVTSFVQKHGYGNYYVANIPEYHTIDAGGDNVCSWQLVVIEEGADLPIRYMRLSLGAKWKFGDKNFDSSSDYDVLKMKVNFANGIKTGGKGGGQLLIGFVNDHDAKHADGSPKVPTGAIFTGKGGDNKEKKMKFNHKPYAGGLYKNNEYQSKEYGLIVGMNSYSGLELKQSSMTAKIENVYWNTAIFIGAAVDIETAKFGGSQTTTIGTDNVTVSGHFVNNSSAEKTGIYNMDSQESKIVVEIDPQLTVTAASCTKADGKALGTANIVIDNANHTVTFKKIKCMNKGEKISYTITCTAASGSISYNNKAYISGNLYSSGVKTGMYIDKLKTCKSKAKRDNGTFGIYLHPNSPHEDGYVAQWYMSGNWCHNNTNWSAGKAKDGTTYSNLYSPYMYKQYTLGKSYTMPQSANISIPGYSTAATGWYTAPEGGDYIPNGAVDLNNLANYVGADGAVHLYAHWVGAPHTLTFNANGGTVGTASVPIRYGTGDYCDVSWNTPVRAGYNFLGWYTATVDGTQVYSATGQCTNEGTYWSDNLCVYNADYTVYAQWQENVYHIRFNGNGATEGTTADMTCNYGQDYKLNENGFKKTGYSFIGWNTQADGTGTAYTDKQSIKDAGDMTLYAQWKINTYKVILHAGNGIESISGAGTYTYGANVTIEATVKPGYHWKDWTGTYQTAEQKYSFTMPAKDVEMTAYADANEYTIRFNPNTGAEKTHIDDITVKYDELVTLPNGGESYVKYTLDGVNITEQIMSGAIVIDINGKVIRQGEPLPEGCVVEEDGTIIYPDGTTHKPDGTVISADGIITSPDGIITYPDGTITYPDGTTHKPDGTITYPDGTTHKPDGSVVAADGTTTTADGTIIAPNGIVTKPDGTVIYPDGTVVLPDGSTQNAAESTETSKRDAEREVVDDLESEADEKPSNQKKDDSTKEKAVSIKKKDISRVKDPQESGDGTGEVTEENGVETELRAAQSLEADTEPQPDKKAYASVYMGWSLEDGKESFTPQWKALEEMSVNDIVAAAGVTEQNGATITLYAIWDDCPWITAVNLYYTLEQAQNGVITVDELLSHASAADREDGSPIAPGVHANGTSFTIPDYQTTDFTSFQHEGSVTENLTVVDSVGSTYVKQITVYIVDTTPVAVLPEGTTRFINEYYYNQPYEYGGLEDNSIWKTDPEYVAALQKAFDNMNNNTPMQTYTFTHEEILQMKEFVQVNGVGNSKYPDALQRFYDQFCAPNLE